MLKDNVSADHVDEKSYFALLKTCIAEQKKSPVQLVSPERLEEIIEHRQFLENYLEATQETGFYVAQTGAEEWVAYDNSALSVNFPDTIHPTEPIIALVHKALI